MKFYPTYTFLFIATLVAFSGSSYAQTLTRGPYLQMGAQTSITIKWRTNIACTGVVKVGPSAGTYTTATTTESGPATEHQINVTGLTVDTKYFYEISSTAGTIFQGGSANFFTTLPSATPGRKLRFAAFGDCGKNQNSFQSQTLAEYTAYLADSGIDAPDAWLLLGDNAYDAGTDLDYTNNFFGAFGSSILKNHKLYPTPGNHDYANSASRQDDHAVPYYSIFTLPTAGEIGGVASGTETYYSYDIGNAHFLALDAYGEEGNKRLYDTTGAQVLWIKNDLAANTKKWTIAYWHHPPYTMGSHNSDNEPELINIRENFIRILERYGVDMIICGHSHDYERSYLLKGYYKANPGDPQLNEIGFNPLLHTASQSSANYDNSSNSCPYTYNSGQFNHGTVYVVAGSSGADGPVQSGYPHDALPFRQDDGGMLYFEVDNNRLDAKFIRRDGVIADKFTIMKDVNQDLTYNVTVGDPVTLTASWPGTYSWNTAAVVNSISVTPPSAGTTNYNVTDAYGCLTDQFTIHATGVLASNPLPVNNIPRPENNTRKFTVKASAYTNNLVLQINSPENGVCGVEVYDLMGRKYKALKVNVTKGINKKEIAIKAGIYLFEVRNEKGVKYADKIMVP